MSLKGIVSYNSDDDDVDSDADLVHPLGPGGAFQSIHNYAKFFIR